MTVLARCAQLWYLSTALVVFATITTFIAIYKPRGPLPAAYGHFRTLADLIDEWPPEKSKSDESPSVLYWGHKSGPDKDGVCYAGTSDKPLPKPIGVDGRPYESLMMTIKMDRPYGGELDPEWPSIAKKESV
ncbi:hypothetical protein FIBSPDRAFT_859029 [Athelia psychrophila]|uniref:Uncharacterized protein n=1 Tax=Athelia psychrophila TaxID=1759441 RepID=A0A166LLD5_9AGAM|nr:hypothetical protein FIBSPDRAFT_859029 [Fibularhizoctonia sp. CBS 109695]